MDTGDGFRMLIVEDDPVYTEGLQRLLERRMPARVSIAGNMEAAQREMAAADYDVVALDYQLPDGDGMELLEQIVALDRHPQVIIITGKGDEELASRASVAGAAGYLVKDQHLPDVIVEAVHRALSLKRDEEERRRNEEEVRALFMNAHDGVLLVDAETGIILGCNDAAEKLFAIPRAKLIGMPRSMLHEENVRARYDDLFGSFVSGERVFMESAEILAGDGVKKTVNIAGSMLLPPGGRRIVVGMFHDTTESREAELALRESEARFRAIFENAPIGLAIVSPAGEVLETNAALQQMLGHDAAELRQLGVRGVTYPQDLDVDYELFRQTVQGERDHYHLEKRFIRKDGKAIWGWMDTFTVRVDDELRFAVSMVEDISERKRAEAELLRINAELSAYDRSLSHDMKSPLSSALSAVSLIQEMLDSPLDAEQRADLRETVGVLKRCVDRAYALVRDLLSLADAGSVSGVETAVNVRDMAMEILLELRQQVEECGAVVEADRDLGTVYANPSQVYRVLSNLFRNALTHCDNETPRVELHLLADEGDKYRYLMRDNGSGIPAENLVMIFEPLFKGHPGGTGLGLAIVAKAIASLGGSIRAYNDGGACFEFTIARGEAEAEPSVKA